MIREIWDKYVLEPRRQKRCADYGFVADAAMDALCERFSDSLANMYYAIVENNKAAIEELTAEQKAIQEAGGEEFKEYLIPYFSIANRWKAGEWGRSNPNTSAQGWARFRTANNWRE